MHPARSPQWTRARGEASIRARPKKRSPPYYKHSRLCTLKNCEKHRRISSPAGRRFVESHIQRGGRNLPRLRPRCFHKAARPDTGRLQKRSMEKRAGSGLLLCLLRIFSSFVQQLVLSGELPIGPGALPVLFRAFRAELSLDLCRRAGCKAEGADHAALFHQ